MTAVIDITGFHFGMLSVLRTNGSDRYGMHWLCQCSCDDRQITVRGIDLRRGRKKSCGCTWRATFETTRVCARCKIEKPKEDFRKGNSGYGLRGYCCECTRITQLARYHRIKEIVLPRMRKERAAFRAEILSAYGGKCTCCGETESMFLAIDHKNNDGAKHRKEVGKCQQFYRWLKKNDYPSDFQILCANCNWGKYVNGGVCPHQTRGTHAG